MDKKLAAEAERTMNVITFAILFWGLNFSLSYKLASSHTSAIF
jgi:hypothetical protein